VLYKPVLSVIMLDRYFVELLDDSE